MIKLEWLLGTRIQVPIFTHFAMAWNNHLYMQAVSIIIIQASMYVVVCSPRIPNLVELQWYAARYCTARVLQGYHLVKRHHWRPRCGHLSTSLLSIWRQCWQEQVFHSHVVPLKTSLTSPGGLANRNPEAILTFSSTESSSITATTNKRKGKDWDNEIGCWEWKANNDCSSMHPHVYILFYMVEDDNVWRIKKMFRYNDSACIDTQVIRRHLPKWFADSSYIIMYQHILALW